MEGGLTQPRLSATPATTPPSRKTLVVEGVSRDQTNILAWGLRLTFLLETGLTLIRMYIMANRLTVPTLARITLPNGRLGRG